LISFGQIPEYTWKDHFMFRTKRARAVTAALGVALALVLGACSSSSSGSGAAAASSGVQAGKSVGQSIMANPTYSAEVTQLENQLLASYQKNFSPLHPIKSMGVALHEVFPSASLSETATFAVHALTPDMAGKSAKAKAARAAWAQTVVKHVLNENPNATAPAGSAVVPGTTPQASPSTTGSTP
jgi:hypothetical protein